MKKGSVPVFFWAVLSIALLMVAGAIVYYLVVFLPSKEVVKNQAQSQNQTTQEEQRKSDTQIRLDCRDEALTKAQDKLRKLIAAGLISSSEKSEYQKALDQGLTKKEDVDYYYKLCLEINGLK